MFSYRLLVAGLFATVLPVLAAETPSCAALKDVHLATLMVSQSELVPAGPDAANPMAPAAPRRNLPEYCVVRGELEGRTGARGAHYGIGFELRLPTKWNHRFLYQGGGGLDGFVAPAVGQISVGNSSAASALERGYAVVSTDSGHHAQNMGDASFGFDQQARLNYAYAAIGTLTTAVLEVVQAYYHQPAAHSYFMGCYNGGREALMAAERFPTLFDGVVAGNPGFRLSRAAVAQAWDLRAFVTAAPSDAHGNKIQARALTAEDMKLVAHAVLDQCDALDGVRDGVIEAMSTCHFKPDALLCKGEKQPTCLTQAQITALHATFDGAHDSHGSPLYATWPYDAGIDEMVPRKRLSRTP